MPGRDLELGPPCAQVAGRAAPRDSIDEECAAERARQDKKWGVRDQSPFKWLAILGEEVGECNRAVLETYGWTNRQFFGDMTNLREELIQVMAVAKATIECLDRNKREEWEG